MRRWPDVLLLVPAGLVAAGVVGQAALAEPRAATLLWTALAALSCAALLAALALGRRG
ncbi:hypothetical protein PMI01_01432 [Caulobacter sp. AP07]|uniref:hypothetical protein n=1 Tax=Caulobacter sp. AP07 TaxID=1144304 RepID=UPI0002720BB9|nr:hypothetical protein [Caulobacter sp. AP07]EJL34739.1 hypothetical protein PMI01_01432 [Caulobacter sp. AP07]